MGAAGQDDSGGKRDGQNEHPDRRDPEQSDRPKTSDQPPCAKPPPGVSGGHGRRVHRVKHRARTTAQRIICPGDPCRLGALAPPRLSGVSQYLAVAGGVALPTAPILSSGCSRSGALVRSAGTMNSAGPPAVLNKSPNRPYTRSPSGRSGGTQCLERRQAFGDGRVRREGPRQG